MSFFYMANCAASVPPVLDTTPCMKQMLDYEDCVVDGKKNTLLAPAAATTMDPILASRSGRLYSVKSKYISLSRIANTINNKIHYAPEFRVTPLAIFADSLIPNALSPSLLL